MSQLSMVLDSLIEEIKARIPTPDILHTEHAGLLNEIASECPFFVFITRLPALTPFFVCNPGLNYLGLNPNDYQKMGNQFFFKVIHPDNYSAIQQSLQHFSTSPHEELLMTCKFKTGKLGWRWVYGASRMICLDIVNAPCDVISVVCDVETLLLDSIYMPKKNHIQTLSSADKRKYTSLTKREMDVLRLLMQEYGNAKIASKLHLSEFTVKTHRKHLLKKMGVKNSIGLVRYAMLSNLLADEGWKKNSST